ncbi:carbohydrate-binding protein [Corynebacterium dentalis]|uniref:carbohydrate-binding protein n=1 Tax=Corynebacterium dentalis TaxID=2014528 RepID=UPI00289A6B95|nr:carbohydrate-binding protein [Corynebacterium dentalis]
MATLEEVKAGIQTLTDSEAAHLTSWLDGVETARRRDAKVAGVAVADCVGKMQDAGTLPKPAAATTPPATTAAIAGIPAWVNPGTNHAKMYRKGAIVRWNGKVWQSMTDQLNSWEPGAAGVYSFIWTDITPATTPTGTAPDGTQANPYPFKAGLNLTVGQYVTYNGSTYKVIQAHTTQDGWNPPAVPSLFTKA